MTPMRCFDPLRVGRWEADAWIAYYQRRWLGVLVAAVQLTRHAFGMPWWPTLRGAWWVLRANQVWAPADNDPERARQLMARFYALVGRVHGEDIDPVEAARLEVRWWSVHRHVQHGDGQVDALVQALTDLYAFLYTVSPAAVRPAAVERAAAMALSDSWVGDGCPDEDPRLDAERAALVRSYAALLAVVHVG